MSLLHNTALQLKPTVAILTFLTLPVVLAVEPGHAIRLPGADWSVALTSKGLLFRVVWVG